MHVDPRSMFAPPRELTPGLRTSRVIAYVEGAVGLVNAVLLIFGGASFATALGLHGAGGTALIIGIGIVVGAISGLLIWGGWLLGRLSRRARAGVLAYQYLSIVEGILSLANPPQAALRVVLAGVAIYYLQFQRQTVALFSSWSPASGGDTSAEAEPPHRG